MSDVLPLYQTLKKSEGTKDFSATERDQFITKIKSLDERGHELMYVLIRLYEQENESTILEFPYESKLSKSELKFSFDAIPVRLKHILNKFIDLHISKMDEENEMTKSREELGIA